MTDVPKSLLDQIKEFEDVFTVDRQKLKEIVAHFIKELEKGTPTVPLLGVSSFVILISIYAGLSVEGGNIVSSAPPAGERPIN
jgi:predicted transcriptional regulator